MRARGYKAVGRQTTAYDNTKRETDDRANRLDINRFANPVGAHMADEITPLDELNKTLDALDKALALLTRLENVPTEHQVYITQGKKRMRWAVRRLAKRAYILTLIIEPDTDDLPTE